MVIRIFLVGLLCSITAFDTLGQDSSLPPDADRPTVQPDEVLTVTGSRLKRITSRDSLTMETISGRELEATGALHLADALNQLSTQSFGAYQQSLVNDERGQSNTANLRGLGPDRTLVLFDGHRLADDAGLGYVDLTSIPLSIIDRLEIVYGTGSAVYGSDAAAGLIHVISKKTLEGGIAKVRWITPKERGGGQQSGSVAAGVRGETWQSLTSVSFSAQEAVFERDRDWTRLGLSTRAFPANYIDRGRPGQAVTQPSPECPPDQLADLQGQLARGGPLQCTYDYAATMGLAPEKRHYQLWQSLRYGIRPEWTAQVQLQAGWQRSRWVRAPNTAEFSLDKEAVSDPNLWTYLGIPEPSGDIDIRYRSVPYGLREHQQDFFHSGANVELQGQVASWATTIRLGEAWNLREERALRGFFLKAPVVQAILDQRFNPFTLNLDADSLATVADTRYQPTSGSESRVRSLLASAETELMALRGGPWSLLVGGEWLRQSYRFAVDPQTESGGVIGLNPVSSSAAEREVRSWFLESEWPLLEKLTLQAATRMDQFSDFGSTLSPRVAFLLKPSSSVQFRGHYAQGFTAPKLRELNGGIRSYVRDVRDLVRCQAQGTAEAACNATREVKIAERSNPELNEERSTSQSLGLSWRAFDGLNGAYDYWTIVIDDAIAAIDPNTLFDIIAKGQSLPDIQYKRLGGDVSRDPSGTTLLEELRIPLQNLGRSEHAGFDLSLDWRWQPDSWQVFGTHRYSRRTLFRESIEAGQLSFDRLGRRGAPRYRIEQRLGARVDGFEGSIKARTIGPMSDQIGTGQLGEHTEWDILGRYRHHWQGEWEWGILNLTARPFPVDRSAGQGDDRRVADLYPLSTRRLYLGLTQEF